MAQQISLDEAAQLFRPVDTVATGLATGQAVAVLDALGRRTDLENVRLYLGIMVYPYAFLERRDVHVLSGFFGPLERAVREQGGNVEYLCEDFIELERLALELKPRVVLAPTTPPDAEGWLSFSLHAGASYKPFLQAAKDPDRLAVAEINPKLPRLDGLEEFGRNRVHISEVDYVVESDMDPTPLPIPDASEEEKQIARWVADVIPSGATLQFGIGALPNEIAGLLAQGDKRDFGIHTEMISDGVMLLHEAGKVTNRKGLYDGVSVATFALGSPELYRWLDGNADVRILPVGEVNDPAVVRRMRHFVSVNGALSVDLLGQVAADYVGGRQYSGVGGHELFVTGAEEAPGGVSYLCLKSTATVAGETVSTIVPRLPAETAVTTPRHHTQCIVTEYGIAKVAGLGDRERGRALIEIAHPDFRDELRATHEAAR